MPFPWLPFFPMPLFLRQGSLSAIHFFGGRKSNKVDANVWDTLPQTNSSPLKMDGWNTTFLLGRPIFRGEPLVSGRVIFQGFPLKIGALFGLLILHDPIQVCNECSLSVRRFLNENILP